MVRDMQEFSKKLYHVYRSDGVGRLFDLMVNYMTNYLKIGFAISRSYWRYVDMRLKYGSAVPKIHDKIYVDPKKITLGMIGQRMFKEKGKFGKGSFIIGGDWDKTNDIGCEYTVYSDIQKARKLIDEDPWRIIPISSYEHYESFMDHFQNGVPWEETKFYKRLTDEASKNSDRYKPKELIHGELEKFDDLYDSIQTRGYLSQEEIQDGQPDVDIMIGIGREGDLILLRGGTHRLVIAQALEVSQIPVIVKLRHQKWQKLRYKLYKASNNTRLSYSEAISLDHPDMRDINCDLKS